MSLSPFLSPPLTLRGVTFDPPLFLAPMAEISHSAFRRLVADFGGAGGLFTEMLSAKMLLNEEMHRSPWTKRRACEGRVIYQLLVVDTKKLPEILEHLAPLAPDGLDLNSSCPAPTIRAMGGGADLFESPERMCGILRVLRAQFAGPLTVKIRLGIETDGWRARLGERLRMLRGEGVDGLTLHPRFAGDKLKREPRHELYAELAAEAQLPLIANGDILDPHYIHSRAAAFAPAAGLMLGRIAAARPWVFAQWRDPALVVDHAAVWQRFCDYVEEDFVAERALGRVKVFTAYFSCNFMFGHNFRMSVQSAPTIAAARERAANFFATGPALTRHINLCGL